MLAIVMLLCFYLVYRDMKRVENNVLGIYKRVGILEKFNSTFSPKMNELLDRSRKLTESELPVEHILVENNVEGDTYEEVDNIMKNVINIHNDVIENEDRCEYLGEVSEVCKNDLDNKLHDTNICEIENKDNDDILLHDKGVYEVGEKDGGDSISCDDNSIRLKDGVKKDGDDDDDKDGEVDGVMDLLNSIENKDILIELSEFNEEGLLEKTNNELKDYLKSKNLPNNGNKKKLVETILNLNEK